MRKFFIFFIIISLSFFSCDSFFEHDFIFENQSDEEVLFTIQNYENYKDVYKLQTKESITLYCYDNPSVSIENDVRVDFVSGQSKGTFVNQQFYQYKIFNTLCTEVYLSEKNKKISSKSIDYIILSPAQYDSKTDNTVYSSCNIDVYSKYPLFSAYIIENDKNIDVTDKIIISSLN